MVDYHIAIEGDVPVDPAAFVAAWNESAAHRAVGEARTETASTQDFMSGAELMLLLGGVASTVATGVLTSLVTELLKRKLFPAAPPAPEVKVQIVEQGPTRVIVIRRKG